MRDALEDFFRRDEWRKAFLRGCEGVAAAEENKPATERAAVPTVENGVVRSAANQRAVATCGTTKNGAVDSAANQCMVATRRRRRAAAVLARNVRRRTRAQARREAEEAPAQPENARAGDAEGEEEG